MKAPLVLVGVMAVVAMGSPQDGYPGSKGAVFGHVVGQNNQPARGIGIEARPLGVALGTVLPHATTDQNGDYKLSVPWWGRYTVYANDLNAGYSPYVTPTADALHPAEVNLSPDHPQAEFDFKLPPKAGFLRFHLTDAKTGVPIHGIEVTVSLAGTPPNPVYSSGTSADKPFLVPSNKAVLIHVTSWGYKEWGRSAKKGKAVRLAPDAERIFNVALEPDAN